jgi:TorA maturation chaperone TorD
MNPKPNPRSQAEFYLCLARAFATPDSDEALELLRDALPGDLDELARECGYDISAHLAEYRGAIKAVPDGAQLLVTYSRLFLVPGDRHPSLNTGVYLDGAVAGGSVTAMEICYRRCGLEKAEGFRDLADHLSVQLEFVAWLLDAEYATGEGHVAPPMTAAEFLESFVARWVRPLREDIEAGSIRFRLAANPYLALARILEETVLTEIRLRTRNATLSAAPAASLLDPEIERLRCQFAGRTMGEVDLAYIRGRLAADGLPTGHVAIPVEERDRVMGLETMTPPRPNTHRVAVGD